MEILQQAFISLQKLSVHLFFFFPFSLIVFQAAFESEKNYFRVLLYKKTSSSPFERAKSGGVGS